MANEFPKQIPAFGGGTIIVTRKIWNHFHAQAVRDKAWAARTSKDKAWIAYASDMSKEMLADRLAKTPDQLTVYAIQYTHMRANLRTGAYGGYPVDRVAHDEWLGLGGALKGKAT
jgi:hypothetical protein